MGGMMSSCCMILGAVMLNNGVSENHLDVVSGHLAASVGRS